MLVTALGLVMIAAAAAALVRSRQTPRLAHDGGALVRPAAAGTVDAPRTRDAAPQQSVQPWVQRGIAVEEAKDWIDRGFDADHAYLLRSLDVDPRTAEKLRDAGLEDSAVVSLVEDASFRHRAAIDDLVALADRAPDVAPEAVGWLALGVDLDRAVAYAAVGFSADAAAPWMRAGWEPDTALPWFAARFEPESALAWLSNGFDVAEARAWKGEHFGVKQAVDWRRFGDTPARARTVERRLIEAGVTVADGLRWLDRGFTVDEICEGWPKLSAGDGPSWRAELKGLSLTPSEISSWCEHFGHDEAMRWVDAGVRDPSAAERLRSRGVDPERVHRVADRLADVFDVVPVTRDDLLSAAGQLARAGGSPDVRHRLQIIAAKSSKREPKEVPVALIEDVLDELHRLEREGALGAPHAAKALARRLEEGLIVSALVTGRDVGRVRAGA